MFRVLGYWLLYATVGSLVVVMMIAGGGDLGSEDKDSPIRGSTKVIGACSGVALAIAGLGICLLKDPKALRTWPTLMVAIGAPLAFGLTVWTWIAIAADLRKRAKHPA